MASCKCRQNLVATNWKKIIYTVKGCELITHVKRFSRTETLVKDFSYIADLLGVQRGCFLGLQRG